MKLLGRDIKGPKGQGDAGADHGELWIVSYADMMTLLFGFFVILFSLSQVDDQKFNALGRDLAEQFKGKVDSSEVESQMQMEARQVRALQMLVAMLNLGEDVEKVVDTIERKASEAQTKVMAKKLLEEELKRNDGEALEKLKLALAEKDDRLEIALPDSLLFESGTADLTLGAKEGLAKVAEYLNKMTGLSAIEVVGHTDSLPAPLTAKYPSNFSLSAARAGAVAEELIRRGVNAEQMSTRGMASLQPLFPEKKEDGTWNRENMNRNRRVSIVVKRADHE